MGIFERILTFVGGTSVAIVALAWLTRSLMSHLLSKDIEHHKAILRATTDAELEKLRAALERESLEHEVKFRRVDDKVAEHLAEIYARLYRLYELSSSYIDIVEFSGEPSKEEKFENVVEANREFWDYFLLNRLYVPQQLFKRIRAVADGLANVVGKFTTGRKSEEQGRRLPEVGYWTKAFNSFKNEVTPLFTDLVVEFQRRLGIEDIDEGASENESNENITQTKETQKMTGGEDEFSEEEIQEAMHVVDPSKVPDWHDEKTHVMWECPKCKKKTAHRTKGIETDPATGERYQWLECTECKTSQKSPTGADGSEYQSNIETSDNTDFGGS